MLCFEVVVNDEGPVIAGAENISVLTFLGTYVASHQDIEFRVGGLISASANVRFGTRISRRLRELRRFQSAQFA